MRYFKIISDGYIFAVSVGHGETEISEEEYRSILKAIRSAPAAPEGFIYLLRADTLDWELRELPPVPEQPEEADAGDYENALTELGVKI